MLVTAVSADDTNNIKLPLWGTHTDKLKTVWKELDPDEHEEECVIPSTWVNQETRKVRWPKGINTIRAMNKLRRPEEKWNTFDLVKVKVSSEFDFTTSAEITDEEKNSQQGDLHLEGKRISKKKTYPEFDTDTGYVPVTVDERDIEEADDEPRISEEFPKLAIWNMGGPSKHQ
ncbi:unnamed protein product [Mytilus edulis]|uniref:Uncharacterized protein n=1 Tax=Mytilus edulis TaxID=6550 RepID=A0A8S3U1F6_MYTED|nr:unnamed protein product [Mytilus edulis]